MSFTRKVVKASAEFPFVSEKIVDVSIRCGKCEGSLTINHSTDMVEYNSKLIHDISPSVCANIYLDDRISIDKIPMKNVVACSHVIQGRKCGYMNGLRMLAATGCYYYWMFNAEFHVNRDEGKDFINAETTEIVRSDDFGMVHLPSSPPPSQIPAPPLESKSERNVIIEDDGVIYNDSCLGVIICQDGIAALSQLRIFKNNLVSYGNYKYIGLDTEFLNIEGESVLTLITMASESMVVVFTFNAIDEDVVKELLKLFANKGIVKMGFNISMDVVKLAGLGILEGCIDLCPIATLKYYHFTPSMDNVGMALLGMGKTTSASVTSSKGLKYAAVDAGLSLWCGMIMLSDNIVEPSRGIKLREKGKTWIRAARAFPYPDCPNLKTFGSKGLETITPEMLEIENQIARFVIRKQKGGNPNALGYTNKVYVGVIKEIDTVAYASAAFCIMSYFEKMLHFAFFSNANDVFELPGGKREKTDNNFFDTALRELKEETNWEGYSLTETLPTVWLPDSKMIVIPAHAKQSYFANRTVKWLNINSSGINCARPYHVRVINVLTGLGVGKNIKCACQSSLM